MLAPQHCIKHIINKNVGIMNRRMLLFCACIFLVPSVAISQPKKTPPITPRWMLEQVVWEDSSNTQGASLRLVDLYLKHQMPVGSIIIDSPWSMAYNDFNWNTARYPNSTEMIRDLNQKNVKVIL